MAPVAVLTEHDLHTRRAHALARLGDVDERELRERAETYELSAQELAVLTELDNIDFLLGGIDR